MDKGGDMVNWLGAGRRGPANAAGLPKTYRNIVWITNTRMYDGVALDGREAVVVRLDAFPYLDHGGAADQAGGHLRGLVVFGSEEGDDVRVRALVVVEEDVPIVPVDGLEAPVCHGCIWGGSSMVARLGYYENVPIGQIGVLGLYGLDVRHPGLKGRRDG